MSEYEIKDWSEFCLEGTSGKPAAIPSLSPADLGLIQLIRDTPDIRELPELRQAPPSQLFRIIAAHRSVWNKCRTRVWDREILDAIELLYFDTHVSLIDLPSRIKAERMVLEDLVAKAVLS